MDYNTGRCLRCGAPYEPNAIVCFTCGAPIGETQTPTNPVPIIRLPRHPADETPPAEEAAQPAAPVAVAKSRPLNTDKSSDKAASGAPRRRWSLIAALCLVVALALGGGGYALHGLAAAPPIAQQTIYQDSQHHFRVMRPALWVVTPTTNGATMSDSDGSSSAQISVTAPAASQTAKAYADMLAKQLGLAPASSQIIGGDEWEQRAGQVTGADGAVRQVVIFVTLHGGFRYTIQLSSPLASFSGINNLVYEPLLGSFQFV